MGLQRRRHSRFSLSFSSHSDSSSSGDGPVMTQVHPGVLSLRGHRSPVRLFRDRELVAGEILFVSVVDVRGTQPEPVDQSNQLQLKVHLLEVGLLVSIAASMAI